MPPHLKVEAAIPKTDPLEWRLVDDLQLGDRDGVVYNNVRERREIFLFGIDPFENRGYILRSEADIDIGNINSATVHAMGLLTMASLDPGQSFELSITGLETPHMTLRFTYFED